MVVVIWCYICFADYLQAQARYDNLNGMLTCDSLWYFIFSSYNWMCSLFHFSHNWSHTVKWSWTSVCGENIKKWFQL